MEENYDVIGMSPTFDVYRQLSLKACIHPGYGYAGAPEMTDLGLLAKAAASMEEEEETPRPFGDTVPPIQDMVAQHIKESLVFPSAPVTAQQPRLLDSLPNNLTSKESMREMVLNGIKKVRVFAEKAGQDMKRKMKRGSQRKEHKENNRKEWMTTMMTRMLYA